MLLAMLFMLGLPPSFDVGGPEPIEPQLWITSDDYPEEASFRHEQGTVDVDVSNDPSGKPVGCRVIQGSGSESLDNRTCLILLTRGRFKPAIDLSGQPIAAGWHKRTTWVLSGGKRPESRERTADLIVNVNKLPLATKDAIVVVRQIQRADGSLESCIVDRPSKSPALDRVACSAATPLAAQDPIVDAAKQPVRGVRWRVIQFEQDGAAAPN